MSDDVESLKKLNASLQDRVKLLTQSVAHYRTLTDVIATIAGESVRPMEVTRAINVTNKYLPMGFHFETLMGTINNSETLREHWEHLMILLRLNGNDEAEDE